MKDPAFLFYTGDFNDGTQDFTNEEVGAYLRLLLFQFSQGHLSLDRIKKRLGIDFDRLWPTMAGKFLKDNNGLYYNQRMDIEMNRRKKYSESRKNNISKRYEQHMNNTSSTHVVHMENEIENEIGIIYSIEKVVEYFQNDYKLEQMVIRENKFTEAQFKQAQEEFWNTKQLDTETTTKPYSDVQTHFLRWCRQNRERIKKPTEKESKVGKVLSNHEKFVQKINQHDH